MINDYNGVKITAKKKAEEELRDAICNKIEYLNRDNFKDLTDNEFDKLLEQMVKIKQRLLKVLHYKD